MSTDQKNIFIMGGVLAAVIVLFVVIFFVFLNHNNSGAPTGPVVSQPGGPNALPVPPPPGAQPAVPPAGQQPAAVPGVKPAAAPAQPPPNQARPGAMPPKPGAPGLAPPVPAAKPPYTPPSAPGVKDAAIRVAALADPFMGGPPRVGPIVPPPTPSLARIYGVSPTMPPPDRFKNVSGGGDIGISIVQKKLPIGRDAGWIYSSNGQVWAIFVDSKGVAQAVTVGTPVSGGLRVKAITPQYLILVDDGTGKEERIKLEGLDTYPGKSRETSVEATPATPRWPGN